MNMTEALCYLLDNEGGFVAPICYSLGAYVFYKHGKGFLSCDDCGKENPYYPHPHHVKNEWKIIFKRMSFGLKAIDYMNSILCFSSLYLCRTRYKQYKLVIEEKMKNKWKHLFKSNEHKAKYLSGREEARKKLAKAKEKLEQAKKEYALAEKEHSRTMNNLLQECEY